MLQIKQKFHLGLPRTTFTAAQPMQLSPVTITPDDELDQAIVDDPDEHDNNWVLTDRPDENELVAYWEKVENDIKTDPTWFRFESE